MATIDSDQRPQTSAIKKQQDQTTMKIKTMDNKKISKANEHADIARFSRNHEIHKYNSRLQSADQKAKSQVYGCKTNQP